MRRPPHSVKDGIFSWPVIFDCLAYGIIMGGTSLASVSLAIVSLANLFIDCFRISLLLLFMARVMVILGVIVTTKSVNYVETCSGPGRRPLPR